EDRGALRGLGEIEEEHLVEPARAEEFRRERLDAVRRRHDEHGRGGAVPAESALLEPGEETADDPAADAGVEVPRARAGEGLLDLVDVEDARGHRLRQPEGALRPRLGLADKAPEDPGHLEPEE